MATTGTKRIINTNKVEKFTSLEVAEDTLGQRYAACLKKPNVKSWNFDDDVADINYTNGDWVRMSMYPCTASIITDDGRFLKRSPKKETFSLREMQSIVGGSIEFLPDAYFDDSVASQYCFIVDEEGKLKGKKFNQLARLMFGVEVVGTLLVVPRILLDHEE